MASANLQGSNSLYEAIQRARGAGIGASAATEWWNSFGQSQLGSRLQAQRLTAETTKREKQATKFNKARETEIRGLYSSILSGLTGSENSLRASGLKDIETQSKRLEGTETQNLISSGLFGTTTAASVPTRVASEFTQPSRLKLEDMLRQRKTEAQLGLAGFVERIQNPYPDYNSLVQAQISANA